MLGRVFTKIGLTKCLADKRLIIAGACLLIMATKCTDFELRGPRKGVQSCST